MSNAIVSGRYSRALFELAEKKGHLAEVAAGLHALARILEDQPKILLLMANPTLTNQEKYALSVATLAGGKTKLLERFLYVLIDKKRFALLPDIQKIFHEAFEKKQGVQEVQMLSATPFSSAILEKFKMILTKKLRSEIRLIPQTDRGILGGFILRFNGKEIDCSFRNRLHEIQQKLTADTGPSF
ncbi:MAG: ATP synthase F1 subunit delta [Omnitrophica bacterium RIFOXYB12_FULL_50_7]|nr:MAG: ATP synthase F1 subunit delta [Omnitrophica bacterium RIFOXYB12_FULL_50_7]